MSLPQLQLILGEFGSGKSLWLLEKGLYLANRYRKGIICNFPINKNALRAYCRARGYRWVEYLSRQRRGIRYLPIVCAADMYKLLDVRSCVILLDEAGVFLNARSWSKVPEGFLGSLVQLRKDFNIFLLAAHYLEQVDKQVRENCQLFTLCRGVSVPGGNGEPRLIFRHRFEFKPAKFHRWEENPQWRDNFLRTFLAASRRVLFSPVFPVSFRLTIERGVWVVPSALSHLFNCFDSFSRLDRLKKPLKYYQYPQ